MKSTRKTGVHLPIPYSRQTINQEDIQAVVKILQSDYITQGPTVANFEKAVTRFCRARHAVAFSSGTAALHGVCFAAGISDGDEVITTTFTFAASANCVLYVGGKPVFADVKKDLPHIDPSEIKKKLTSKTRAIIPVDYAGIPADYDAINYIAKKHELIVIADAAHSLGATYKRRKVGTLADMTVFSFHPVKAITTGEGGMVVTNSAKFYERLKLFRNHGITKNPMLLKQKSEGPWYYEMQELGLNYRLTDIQAALGISQLKRLPKFIKRRNEIVGKYIKAFKGSKLIDYLTIPNDCTSAWHLFPILLNTPKLIRQKKEIVKQFNRAGIKVQVHYIPVHLHPYYKERFGYKKNDFPNVEEFYKREISLPLFPKLTDRQIKRVIKGTYLILEKYA